jgi:hypothetical protein
MLRSLFFLVSIVLLSASAQAKRIVTEEFFVADPDRVYFSLLRMNQTLSFDHFSSNGYEVYGPEGTSEVLARLGVEWRDIKLSDKDTLNYPSFPQVEANLKRIAAKFPEIMRIFSVGKSGEGRDLWVIKISDSPDLDEVEPEMKYISSMHGNEITGRELLPTLIEEIGDRFKANDPMIRNLVNSTEIFIMPSMNPDGSERRQRANARGVDLNRDFPDFTSDNNNSPNGREAETRAIMAFQAGRNFALSANFHGGAEVVNYPWDTTSVRHPFDRLVRELSISYASLVPYMRNSREFPQGIVNGYDWYEVDGGMQDWSYHWYNDLQVTIELSDAKWPSYSEIPRFYQENRDALIQYIASVHQGAGFFISTNGVTGSAQVFAIQPDGTERDLGSYNFINSEFYKVLEGGKYRFVVNPKLADGTTARTLEFSAEVGPGLVSNNGNFTELTL